MSLSLHIDLDDDGGYLHAASDLSPYLLKAAWRLGFEHAYASFPAEGHATLTLNNASRRFSPENPTSPLYGLLTIGKRIRLQLNTSGGLVTLWQGWLEAVSVDVNAWGERTATLRCRQGLERLRTMPIGLPVQVNQDTGTIVERALSTLIASPTLLTFWQLGLSGRSELGNTSYLLNSAEQIDAESGRTILAYVGDTWAGPTPIEQALIPLVMAENGVFWQGRTGKFHFRNRHYWTLNQTLIDSFSVEDATHTAEYVFGDTVINTIQVTAFPRTISDPHQSLWQTVEPVTLNGLAQRAIQIALAGADGNSIGILAVDPPAAFSHFTAVDTAGNDVTFAITVSVMAEGSSLKITLSSIWLTQVFITLQITGQTVSRANPLHVDVQGDNALAAQGPHRQIFVLSALDNPDMAEDFARWQLVQRAEPSGRLAKIGLYGRDASWIDRMAALEFGVRLHMEASESQSAGDYFVIGEAWHASPSAGLYAEYNLLPAGNLPYWVLDSSLLGIKTHVAY